MKVIGIIAEYNPFHNGHAYQIARIREKASADYVVVAMSGDFVQRGTPAIIDKYARTKMALSCGADLVLELPALWATSSAESFAMAGVTLLEKMGCVDGICFGAETDNLPLLTQIASLLAEEPQEYRDALSSYLKAGASFPAARAKAVCDYLAGNHISAKFANEYTVQTLDAVMNEPNNILAVEYLKAIRKRGSSLTPYLIKREGAGYHETMIQAARDHKNTCYGAPTASATAIRNVLAEQHLAANDHTLELANLAHTMPASAHAVLTEYLSNAPAVWADDFSSILGYLLLIQEKEKLASIADCSEEIANRFVKNRYQFSSFSKFCAINKSRDVTYSRISRILLHLLLDITDADYQHGKKLDYVPYLRILGFRRTSSALLGTLKKSTAIPVISKLADASAVLSNEALSILEKDIFAADLYDQVLSQNPAKKTTPRSEYTREIVLL